jgi:DNA-binding protein H-NS
MKTRIADGEARDRLIIWIRRRMEEFGITIDALAASIEHDRRHPPLYRDARGNEWNGLGPMPDWLQAAKHAGVDPNFFRIEEKSAAREADTHEPAAAARQLDLFG